MRIKFLLVGLLCAASAYAQQVSLKVSKDTVRIVNAELVIENGSKQKSGFLYNKSNGLTSFQSLGRVTQFRVGATDAPAAGTSTFTDTTLKNTNVKVWRNGLLQYRDYANGILFETTTGTITFYPDLATNDRIYIESTKGYDTDEPQVLPGSSNLTALNVGVFDNGDNSFVLRWAVNHTSLYHYPRVIGIGSSTLAGYGLTEPNRLGDRIQAWLTAYTISPYWANYSVGGYTSANVLPVSMGGISGHNIETAIAGNPDVIFISLPTNDAGEMSVTQSMNNLRYVDGLARAAGIPAFIETTQPRTSYESAYQTKLLQLADSIRRQWPDRYVEGMINIRDTTSAKPADILPVYNNGDGTHLTPTGVQIVATNLFKRWENYFQPITGVNKYVIDTSFDGTTWAQYDVVNNPNQVKKSYTRPRSGLIYFRVKATLVDASVLQSGIASLVPPTSAGNNFDHRVLIDLGGDGVAIPSGKPTASPDQWGKRWNNWTGSGGATGFVNGSEIGELVTTTNMYTPIKITIVGNPDGGYTGSGTKAMNFTGIMQPVGDYPKEAVQDNMFIYNIYNTNSPDGVILRVTGLSSTNQYRFKLWGARVDDGATSRMMVSRLGTQDWSQARQMETKYGSSQAGDYNTAIIHDVSGVTTTDIHIKPATGASFTHLSLIDIGIIGELPKTAQIDIRDTTVTLPVDTVKLVPTITGLDTTMNLQSFQWTQLSGPSNAPIDNNISQDATVRNLTNGIYVFKLTMVVDGKNISDEVRVTVMPDNGGKKVMRVHFSKTAADEVPGWTNVFGTPGRTGTAVISKQDPATGWIISNVRSGAEGYWVEFAGESSSNNGGHTTGNNSGPIPDIVMLGFWYNYTLFAGDSNMVISNLNPAKHYSITMFPSRAFSADTARYGYYRLNGGEPVAVKAHANVDSMHTFLNVSPNAQGRISLSIHSPEGTLTQKYGGLSYINAILIKEED